MKYPWYDLTYLLKIRINSKKTRRWLCGKIIITLTKILAFDLPIRPVINFGKTEGFLVLTATLRIGDTGYFIERIIWACYDVDIIPCFDKALSYPSK